jgi:hypothetical protein
MIRLSMPIASILLHGCRTAKLQDAGQARPGNGAWGCSRSAKFIIHNQLLNE